MRGSYWIGAALAATCVAQASAAAPPSSPTVPIIIEADENRDACGSLAVVTGLNPRGDGFLSVRSGPETSSNQIDKLFNGAQVHVCDVKGDFYGVVYSHHADDCNVTSPWPVTMPYTGPCRSGWVHRRWIKLIAG